MLNPSAGPVRIYPLIALLGVMAVGVVALLAYMAEKMVVQNLPLVAASIEIKSEVTLFHLWFEERIEGDLAVSEVALWRHLDQAQWYARAMLDGGHNHEGSFVATDDPLLRAEIEKILLDLNELRMVGLQRFSAYATSRVGTDIDQAFDAVFNRVLLQAENVKAALRVNVNGQLLGHRVISTGLAAFCLMVILMIGAILHRFERARLEFPPGAAETDRPRETAEPRYGAD